MKKTVIGIAAAMLCCTLHAQTLAMPDTEDTTTPAPTQQQEPSQSETEVVVEAEYNTPSKSYKAERNAIRKGNKLFEQEKYHEALEEYDKALAVNSGSIRGRFNKAVTLLQLQSDDNKGTSNDPRAMAVEIFQGLIPDAKSYDTEIAWKAYYDLGNIAFNDEQYDQSIALYKNALRINPDDLPTRENLRLAQLKKQEQEQQNQDQNQDQQDKKDQQQQQQQQQQDQQQDQQQQDQQQQQQQQQEQPMTQSAQQILQSMQNKENQTRKKVKEQEVPAGRPQTDKPW